MKRLLTEHQAAAVAAEKAIHQWALHQLERADPKARAVFQLVTNRAGIIAAIAAAAIVTRPRLSASGIPITKRKA